MLAPRTTKDVLRSLTTSRGSVLSTSIDLPQLESPLYLPPNQQSDPDYPNLPRPYQANLGLAVESMKRHTTDEGWQIFAGLGQAGYILAGHRLAISSTDVEQIIRIASPVQTVVVQDKREWDLAPRDFRDPFARFRNVEYLRQRSDIFKVTILKDSHQRPEYHRQSAEEMGVNAWVVYYHPKIVCRLAPYIRPEHLIRTYHSIDGDLVPPYDLNRKGCLLSGAVSGVYPLRKRLIENYHRLPEVTYLAHPGYHRNGCCTPAFLQELSKYKVAICTSSIYGYALRKIIEATACGCIVITDLPSDEILPGIDGNLVRIHPETPDGEVTNLLNRLYREYDSEKQRRYALVAQMDYDYRVIGSKLTMAIETMRRNYV